jgi:ribonuclease VapC
MILDTSAIVATIANEPDRSRFQDRMLGAPSLAISSVTVLETRIVLQSRQGAEADQAFDAMLENAGIHHRAVRRGNGRGGFSCLSSVQDRVTPPS